MQLKKTFYLVRHAHADWTVDENRSLSARGRGDANRVAEILRAYAVGAIYSSPFPRARETVAPLSNQLVLPIQIDPDLEERRLGNSSPVDFFKAVEMTWRDPSFAYSGGESNAAAQSRGLDFLQRVQERCEAEHIVLSTHGNLMALMLQAFDPAVGFAYWKSLTMPDIYMLTVGEIGEPTIVRVWQDTEV